MLGKFYTISKVVIAPEDIQGSITVRSKTRSRSGDKGNDRNGELKNIA